jgi:hypothetical protein
MGVSFWDLLLSRILRFSQGKNKKIYARLQLCLLPEQLEVGHQPFFGERELIQTDMHEWHAVSDCIGAPSITASLLHLATLPQHRMCHSLLETASTRRCKRALPRWLSEAQNRAALGPLLSLLAQRKRTSLLPGNSEGVLYVQHTVQPRHAPASTLKSSASPTYQKSFLLHRIA